MKKIIKGITFSYNRNMGWQDRLIRTIIAVVAAAGAFYLFTTHLVYSIMLAIAALALLATVFSARCMVCYFAGQCTIGNNEKRQLDNKGIKYENDDAKTPATHPYKTGVSTT
ncbi:MAG: DUF2892 domain-containing protein [Agriterribacter sp.]